MEPKGESCMKSINPATGEVIAHYADHSEAEMEARLTRAARAAAQWREVPLDQRAAQLRAMGEQLERQAETLGALMTAEMGKPIGQAEGEARKCAWVCRYYADHGPQMLQERHVSAAAGHSLVRFDPIGVVLSIMPWNFPLWQVLRFAAPALLAGNAVVVKHAPNVQGTAEAIEALALEAGLPEGLLINLRVGTEQVAAVIADRRIAAVTLTGSDRAGRAVASHAGQALKKTVLELGGSDPAIVLADADLRWAIPQLIRGRMQNSGQSCIAIKRILVHRSILESFTQAYVEAVQDLHVGDPTDHETDVGPLARADLVDTLEAQVTASVEAGARVLVGGHRLDRPGYFYAPTVLADVPADAPARTEEVFGPVATLIPFETVEEAVAIANATRFGLASSIWTRDRALAQSLIPQMEAGSVFINRMPGSDPRLPFGGVKESGYGRELGIYGLMEFVNVRTVCID
ncbi:MAG: NAD-dependent succinate-semialdehyde dehydrogenase [Myxococcota bacterium]